MPKGLRLSVSKLSSPKGLLEEQDSKVVISKIKEA